MVCLRPGDKAPNEVVGKPAEVQVAGGEVAFARKMEEESKVDILLEGNQIVGWVDSSDSMSSWLTEVEIVTSFLIIGLSAPIERISSPLR